MVEIIFDEKEKKSVAYDNHNKIGECDFIETDDYWNIVHTQVEHSYQGQGIAKKLVESIMENAKKSHKKLIAECYYAKKIIQ